MLHRRQGGSNRNIAGRFVGAGLALLAAFAWGQFQIVLPTPAPVEEESSQSSHLRRLPSNPLASSDLEGIRAALDAGQSVRALQSLQQMLDDEPDFFESRGQDLAGSFLTHVQSLVRQQRREYERLFGAKANQLLEEARKSQDRRQYEEIIRRFADTAAGGTALQELARLDRDRGDLSRAAHCLELWADHPDCRDSSAALRSGARMLAAGGEVAAANELLSRRREKLPANTADWLNIPRGAQTPAPQDAVIGSPRTTSGDINQLGSAPFAPALGLAWSAELLHTYDFESLSSAPQVMDTLLAENLKLLHSVESEMRHSKERVAFPAVRPLIVGDVVLAAGPASFKAFRLRDGKLEGSSVDVDETFDHLAVQTFSSSEISDAAREEKRDLLARIRGWRDLTSFSMSTDGRRLYAILDCQLVGTTSAQRTIQSTQKHPLLPRRENRLVALDIDRDLKKRWPLPESPDLFDQLPQAPKREIFYLGAPLPMEDRLFVMGEERGQVQLFEISPETGEILWSLGLLNPDSNLVLNMTRRLSGLSPSSGGGLLICPVGEDVITAVDPLSRRVVWTHSYASLAQNDLRATQLRRNLGIQSFSTLNTPNDLLDDERWFDSRVLVAGERVIFTPPDSDTLQCLDLRTGKPAWSRQVPRTRLLYSATATAEEIVVVGRHFVTAIKLADGSPAWAQPVPIPWPAGRGVRMGTQFLQPLHTGEIAVIDLPTGRLLARLPFPEGMIPGNLTAGGGVLVCQSATRVQAFRSLGDVEAEIASLLAANPLDPRALTLRGELSLQRGDITKGLADLRAALANAPDDMPRTKQILSWTLLEGLRTNFAANRDSQKELEALLISPQQRLDYLGTLAQGLQASGDFAPAFEKYLELLQVMPLSAAPRELDNSWSVSPARWVIGRMEELIDGQDAAALRPQLLNRFARWIDTEAGDDIVFHLLGAMPRNWLPEEILLSRVARIPTGHTQPHWREAVLRPCLDAKQETVRMEAARQLAELGITLSHSELAGDMLTRMSASTVSLSGRPGVTAAEFAQQIRREPAWAAMSPPSLSPWPAKFPQIRTQQNQNYARTYQVPWLGTRSSSLAGWSFLMDQVGTSVDILNQHGEHCGQAATNQALVRYGGDTEFQRHVTAINHLACVVLHDRFVILDTLTDAANPRGVGVYPLVDGPESNVDARVLLSSSPGIRAHLAKTLSGPAGTVGPLLASQVCFSVGSNLVAIDPATGRELWRRRDLETGAEILADERYVLVKPVSEEALLVYRACDGRFLKQVPLPAGVARADARRGGDWGRLLPLVVQTPTGREWRMFDPVEEKVLWTQPLDAAARWTSVDGGGLAFLGGDGQFVIRDGQTGHKLLETKVELADAPEQVMVLQSAKEWILLPGRVVPRPLTRMYGMLMPAEQTCVMAPVHGNVCAFDRSTGKQLWSKRIEHQQVLSQLPVDWPVLAFSALPPDSPLVSSLVLQRSTGEELWRDQRPLDGLGVGYMGKTAPRQIQLRFGGIWLVLGQDESQPEEIRPRLAPPQRE